MNKISTFINVFRYLKNPLTYFLDYFKINKSFESIYFLKDGTSIYMRPNSTDRATFNEIFIHKNYTKYFSLKDEDIVLDIGAHIGLFSLFASKFIKNGKILSFEPSPQSFYFLDKNSKLNKIKNISIFNIGILDKSGERDLIISDDSLCNSFFNINYDNKLQTRPVKIKNINRIIKENNIDRIDFLKMDVEGSEYDILFKISKKNIKIIKKMAIEYHNLNEKRNKDTIINFLKTNGFLFKLEPDNINQGMIYALNKNK